MHGKKTVQNWGNHSGRLGDLLSRLVGFSSRFRRHCWEWYFARRRRHDITDPRRPPRKAKGKFTFRSQISSASSLASPHHGAERRQPLPRFANIVRRKSIRSGYGSRIDLKRGKPGRHHPYRPRKGGAGRSGPPLSRIFRLQSFCGRSRGLRSARRLARQWQAPAERWR